MCDCEPTRRDGLVADAALATTALTTRESVHPL
jgi:hypothetical protein